MKGRLLGATTLSLGLALSLTALAIDPPFPSGVALTGSTVYNPKVGGNPPGDWDVNVGANSKLELTTSGLRYEPKPSQSQSIVAHQFIPSFVVADGVVWAKFRVTLGDLDNNGEDIGFFMGLYTTDTDPFDDPPGKGVYFHKPTGTQQVELIVNDGTEVCEDGPVIDHGETWDFVIKAESNASGYCDVTFWYRECSCGIWTDYSTSDYTPIASASLRFSAAVKSLEDGDSLTLRLFEYEADR